MSAKKPNILECDGIIIRGPDGRKRAEIEVKEAGHLGQVVALHMYGDTDLEVPEPAVSVYVDGEGHSSLSVDYAGVDNEGLLHARSGVRIGSGDVERSPKLSIWGRNVINDHLPVLELPERPTGKVGARAVNEIREAIGEVASEHELSPKQISSILDGVDWAQREAVTS